MLWDADFLVGLDDHQKILRFWSAGGENLLYPSVWKKTLFMELRQFLDLELIVNVYATLYWFFIQAFSIDSKEATIKRLP